MEYYGDIKRRLEEESYNRFGKIDKDWVAGRLSELGWTPDYQKIENKIRKEAEAKFTNPDKIELYVVQEIKKLPEGGRKKGRPKKYKAEDLEISDNERKLMDRILAAEEEEKRLAELEEDENVAVEVEIENEEEKDDVVQSE